MNIYVLKRTDPIAYDETIGFVIAAESEGEARTTASECAGDEPRELWLAEGWPAEGWPAGSVRVQLIGLATDGVGAGIILRSFNAG